MFACLLQSKINVIMIHITTTTTMYVRAPPPIGYPHKIYSEHSAQVNNPKWVIVIGVNAAVPPTIVCVPIAIHRSR